VIASLVTYAFVFAPTFTRKPWFLDGKLTSTFRDEPHIDGSFLSKSTDYLPSERKSNILFLDWSKDPEMQSKGGIDIVEALSPDGIWGLVERGKVYAEIMEQNGTFEGLQKKSGAVSPTRIRLQ
jgi:hypothetical protein